MNYPKTAEQINSQQVGSFKIGGGQISSPIPTEPQICSRAPSGSWEFHVWKANAKKDDKCFCGKMKYNP